MSDNEFQLATSVYDEVTSWLFDDYLPTWVGVAAGTIARGPEFILDYWAAPLHFSTDQGGQWFHDASAVVQFLEGIQSRLQAQGYGYTDVPDYKVSVYNKAGAAIDVIWSRRRPMEPRSSEWQCISNSAAAKRAGESSEFNNHQQLPTHSARPGPTATDTQHPTSTLRRRS